MSRAARAQHIVKPAAGHHVGIDRVLGLAQEDLLGQQARQRGVRIAKGVFGVEHEIVVDGRAALRVDHPALRVEQVEEVPRPLGVAEEERVLPRRNRQLHGLAHELHVLRGRQFLLLGVADVNVAVLDDEDRPAPAETSGRGRHFGHVTHFHLQNSSL